MNPLKICFFLTIFYGLWFPAHSNVFHDKLLIIVGNEVVLQSDLDAALEQSKSLPNLASLGEEQKKSLILNQIVDGKILYAVAQKDTSVFISEAEVEQSLSLRLQQMASQIGGNLSQLDFALKQQGSNLTDFKRQARKQIGEQLLIQKLQSKYLASINQQTLSSQQIQDFYQEFSSLIPQAINSVNLSFIKLSIQADKETIQETYRRCDSVIKLIQTGANFEEMAQRFSDDPSGSDGGDIDFIKTGSIDPHYERVAFNLDINQVSNIPVRTQFGYHIIKTTDRKDREVRSSHILFLIETTEKDQERVFNTLNTYKQKIESQKFSFENLAQQISEDKPTKKRGGNLGWLSYDEIPPKYKEIADTLRINQISEPIWIDEKYFLFQVKDKAEKRTLTLEDDWIKISNLAKNHYIDQVIQSKIEEWKNTVYIKNLSSIPLKNEPLIFNAQ